MDLSALSCGKLKKLIAEAREQRRRRYPRSKGVRYGNIPRALSPPQLKSLLGCVKNEKAHLAFSLMATMGYRAGEVVTMRREQLDFCQWLAFVKTEKTRVCDCIPIPPSIRERLEGWCRQSRVQETGWVFWSGNPSKRRDHISAHWLDKEFRIAAELSGLNASYDLSRESSPLHRARKLYQFTAHSLRHTYGCTIRRLTGDAFLTQALLRHTDIRSTQIYARPNRADLEEAVFLLEY